MMSGRSSLCGAQIQGPTDAAPAPISATSVMSPPQVSMTTCGSPSGADQASSAHRSVVGPTASMLVNWLKPLTGSKIDVMTTRPELICAIG
jgi:hypothetical protein